MNLSDKSPSDPAREITVARLINASRERVFAAWTDVAHISNWWGPQGFTTTTHTTDVRPGGVWRFVMHGPDGRDYQNQITYLEIDPPSRLVYRHDGSAEVEPVEFVSTVTFDEADGKTQLTMRLVFPSAAERDRVAREYGGHQTLGRLDDYLANTPGDELDRTIVSSRLIAAPREKVFRAWTEPEHLRQWWGPAGFTNTFQEFDLKPGGHWRFVMHSPNGVDFANHSVFVEMVKPERIVFDHLSTHLFRGVVEFIDEADRTRVVFRMIHDTAENCRKLRPMCIPANEQNFDRLEAELARMS
jgi:uncharacterized protein YndB with AHSA1/START domain